MAAWFMLAYLAVPFQFSHQLPQERREALVRTGLDVIVAEEFKPLRGKTIGLVTNHTASDRHGRYIVDLFLRAKDVRLAALFAPEHGLRGRSAAGERIAMQNDSASGLPIYSLYGATRKPTVEMLRGLGALVFDMQDAGARFYTYISTMALALEAAAEADIEFYVLDRPNPLGGRVEGPVLEGRHRSFVGIHPIALRHGMTIGELARMFLGEKWHSSPQDSNNSALRARTHWSKLRIIPMQNWRHAMLFSETGLAWIAPSPNMTLPQTALLYPGMALLEATNFSEGRGTARPFEVMGAPWLNPALLMRELQNAAPGIVLDSTRFTPVDIPGKAMNPKFEGQECIGLELTLTEQHRFEPVRFGIALLCALQKTHPAEFSMNGQGLARLSGVDWLCDMIAAGESPAAIWQKVENDTQDFRRLRKKYLLYED